MQAEKIQLQCPQGVPPRLLAEYIDRCRAALPDVKGAVERSDYAYIGILGHRLRGSGAAYGVPWLTEVGSLIEQSSGRGDAAELRRQVTALEEYLSRIEIDSV